MEESSTPLKPDEDGPAIPDAIAPTVGEGGGTYKTSSK
jgi:hypothetical protein